MQVLKTIYILNVIILSSVLCILVVKKSERSQTFFFRFMKGRYKIIKNRKTSGTDEYYIQPGEYYTQNGCLFADTHQQEQLMHIKISLGPLTF